MRITFKTNITNSWWSHGMFKLFFFCVDGVLIRSCSVQFFWSFCFHKGFFWCDLIPITNATVFTVNIFISQQQRLFILNWHVSAAVKAAYSTTYLQQWRWAERYLAALGNSQTFFLMSSVFTESCSNVSRSHRASRSVRVWKLRCVKECACGLRPAAEARSWLVFYKVLHSFLLLPKVLPTPPPDSGVNDAEGVHGFSFVYFFKRLAPLYLWSWWNNAVLIDCLY